jgi:hypothetical protein
MEPASDAGFAPRSLALRVSGGRTCSIKATCQANGKAAGEQVYAVTQWSHKRINPEVHYRDGLT